MIDPKLFTLESLLATMLDTAHGNRNAWWALVEIIPKYMPPHPTEHTRPKCVVRCGESFLRYSAGPRQGHFWDVYGEDYQTPELALLATLEAPVPPWFVSQETWARINPIR